MRKVLGQYAERVNRVLYPAEQKAHLLETHLQALESLHAQDETQVDSQVDQVSVPSSSGSSWSAKGLTCEK